MIQNLTMALFGKSNKIVIQRTQNPFCFKIVNIESLFKSAGNYAKNLDN